jgi:hypothetical protein
MAVKARKALYLYELGELQKKYNGLTNSLYKDIVDNTLKIKEDTKILYDLNRFSHKSVTNTLLLQSGHTID